MFKFHLLEDSQFSNLKAVAAGLLEKFPTLTLWWLSVSLLVGMICLGFTVSPGKYSPEHYIGVELLIAGSATVVGILLGFLFGIPRTLVNKNKIQESDTRPSVLANTNLEDISDWLTKILVGVGLTQFKEIARYLKEVVKILSVGFEHSPAPEATTYAVLTLFSILGFLLGWLATRLHLGRSMQQADFGAIAKRMDDLVSHQKTIEESMSKQIDDLKAHKVDIYSE